MRAKDLDLRELLAFEPGGGVIRFGGMFIGMNAMSTSFSASSSGTHSVTPAKRPIAPR